MFYRWKDIELLVSELAGSAAVGVPLADALRCAKERLGKRLLGRKLGDVITGLQAGQTLSEALGNAAEHLSPVLLAIIRSGEVSGRVDILIISKHGDVYNMRFGLL